MLAKIGNVFFNESRLEKYLRLTKVLFVLGVVLVICFPIISENTYNVEKHLKNSPQITLDVFSTYYKKYFTATLWDIQTDPALHFALQIFRQTASPDELDRKILSKHFVSPRGDKKKFIMINLVYNKRVHSFTSAYKANLVFYVLMHLLQDTPNVP